jgi:hypothetical protein
LEALVTITSSGANGWGYSENPQNANVFIASTTTISGGQLWNGPPGGALQKWVGAGLLDPEQARILAERQRKEFEALREEARLRRERQERPPMHWWIPDQSGHVCAVCDLDNIYRGVPDAHMPLIKEDPEPEDWWRELGAA